MAYKELINRLRNNNNFKEVERTWNELGDDRYNIDNIMSIATFACRDKGYAREYDQVLRRNFGDEAVDRASRGEGVRPYTEAELEAQYRALNGKEPENDASKDKITFATHSYSAFGSAVDFQYLVPSNVLTVATNLIFEIDPILSSFNRFQSDRQLEMPEVDLQLTTTLTNEGGSIAEQDVRKRSTPQTLDPASNKIGVITKVTQNLLNSPLSGLLADLQSQMLYAVSRELTNQAFNGTDTGNEMHGLLKEVGSGADKRGALTTTLSGNYFDRLTKLYRDTSEELKQREDRLVLYLSPRSKENAAYIKNNEDRYVYADRFNASNRTLTLPDGTILNYQLVPHSIIGDYAVIGRPNDYIMPYYSNLQLTSDNGIKNFDTDEVLLKVNTYVDGGYRKNLMEDGNSNRNTNQNVWRKGKLS